MAIQTTYATTRAIGLPGMVADSSRRKDTISRIAASACTAGLFVVRDSDGKCKPPAASTDITTGAALGIAMYDASKLPGTYGANDMVAVLHNGRVLVNVEEAVTEGNPVYVRFAAGSGGTVLGAFRKSADVTDESATAALLPRAKFTMTQGTAGGLSEVEINVP